MTANESALHATTSDNWHGITSVEVVVAALVLGVLAAITLPRFLNMGQDARLAKINAIYGSIQVASQVTYAQSLARGNSGSNGSIATQSGTVSTVYGYPDIGANGIVFAAGMDPAEAPQPNADGLMITRSGSTLSIAPIGVASAAKCRVSYTPPSLPTGTPTIVLAAEQSGC
jgi:MSHA pilin protein MshA